MFEENALKKFANLLLLQYFLGYKGIHEYVNIWIMNILKNIIEKILGEEVFNGDL